MTPDEYQTLAMKTNDGKCSARLYHYIIEKQKIKKGDQVTSTYELSQSCGDLVCGAMGLSEESGEVEGLIKKFIFHGHALDIDKVKKELGDVCWYIAMICHALGLDLEDVMQANIDKLKKRYPNGFSEQDSINREE